LEYQGNNAPCILPIVPLTWLQGSAIEVKDEAKIASCRLFTSEKL
jgi:hypothetical protein